MAAKPPLIVKLLLRLAGRDGAPAEPPLVDELQKQREASQAAHEADVRRWKARGATGHLVEDTIYPPNEETGGR